MRRYISDSSMTCTAPPGLGANKEVKPATGPSRGEQAMPLAAGCADDRRMGHSRWPGFSRRLRVRPQVLVSVAGQKSVPALTGPVFS
jgi:hypothetical protein